MIANVGFNALLAITIPALLIIYPVAISLIQQSSPEVEAVTV